MWTSLQHEIVSTRKPHKCAGCWRMFPAGVEMRVSVGMWYGDPPSRRYYCLVCDDWITGADYMPGNELPDENWALDYDRDEYAAVEAKLADYIREAKVLTQSQFRAMGEMYHDLDLGERRRAWDEQKAKGA